MVEVVAVGCRISEHLVFDGHFADPAFHCRIAGGIEMLGVVEDFNSESIHPF